MTKENGQSTWDDWKLKITSNSHHWSSSLLHFEGKSEISESGFISFQRKERKTNNHQDKTLHVNKKQEENRTPTLNKLKEDGKTTTIHWPFLGPPKSSKVNSQHYNITVRRLLVKAQYLCSFPPFLSCYPFLPLNTSLKRSDVKVLTAPLRLAKIPFGRLHFLHREIA